MKTEEKVKTIAHAPEVMNAVRLLYALYEDCKDITSFIRCSYEIEGEMFEWKFVRMSERPKGIEDILNFLPQTFHDTQRHRIEEYAEVVAGKALAAFFESVQEDVKDVARHIVSCAKQIHVELLPVEINEEYDRLKGKLGFSEADLQSKSNYAAAKIEALVRKRSLEFSAWEQSSETAAKFWRSNSSKCPPKMDGSHNAVIAALREQLYNLFLKEKGAKG